MVRSDAHFYSLFSACPNLFKDLANLETEEDLTFDAVVIKELEVRLDGFFRTSDPESPNYVVEFHGYRKKGNNVYYQLLSKLGLIGNKIPDEPVAGVILFTHKKYDPKTWPWFDFSQLKHAGFRVLYLEDVLKALTERQPDHPLIPTFTPFLASDEQFQSEVYASFQKLKQLSLPEKEKSAIEDVFFSWIMERSGLASKEEVLQMLAELTPMEETPVYQHIKSLGIQEGMEKGVERGFQNGIMLSIQLLTDLLKDGKITNDGYLTSIAPLKEQLKKIQSTKHTPWQTS